MVAFLGNFFSWLGVGFPAFLFVITLVVFFHELGHFIVARWFRVRVEAFSIGFGREIFGFTDKKGTRWKVSWLPLGGYVKFLGDADVTSRPNRNALREIESGHLSDRFDDGSEPLHVKPVWQRAAVAAAGPVANFLLAIVIFACVSLAAGKPAAPPVIEAVNVGSAAATAGMQAGDRILKVGDSAIRDFAQLQRIVSANARHHLHIIVERAGRQTGIDVVPSAV